MPHKELKRSDDRELTHKAHPGQPEHASPVLESPVSSNELRRAVASPRSASPAGLIGLQRAYGNQAVQRLIQAEPASLQRFKWNPFKKAVAEKSLDLNNLLRNKEFYGLFYQFCVKEFSTENIECWSDIEAFKASPNMPRARRIYKQYFADELASRAVNIPNKVRKDITDVMNDAHTNGVGDLTSASALFDTVEIALIGNLSDTFARFTITPQYSKWRKANPNV
jgi:hypothetical protein